MSGASKAAANCNDEKKIVNDLLTYIKNMIVIANNLTTPWSGNKMKYVKILRKTSSGKSSAQTNKQCKTYTRKDYEKCKSFK